MSYIVVTPKKIVHFNTHSEAFNDYETKPKPCGVYEISEKQNDTVYAVNVKASFHGDFKAEDSFIHLHNILNANNYKEGTR